MLLSSIGTITIDVLHLNAVPEPVCAALGAGLFTDGGPLWRALADLNSPATAADADRNATVATLLALRENAVLGDMFKSSPRTRALDQLGNLAARGSVIAEGSTSFDLACSLDGVWALGMAAPSAPRTPLNLSLLAFDRDEDGSTTYAVLEPPARGSLFATSALPGASYSQAEERTFLEIGDSFYQVCSLAQHSFINSTKHCDGSVLLPSISMPFVANDSSAPLRCRLAAYLQQSCSSLSVLLESPHPPVVTRWTARTRSFCSLSHTWLPHSAWFND